MSIILTYIISICLTLLYLVLIRIFWKGWEEVSNDENEKSNIQPFVSVIVAARNEEEVIEDCIASILKSDYNSFELIIVDNDSTDRTASIVKSINDDRLIYLYNNVGYKKESLHKAIECAKGEILLFTDADCMVQKYWISQMITPIVKSVADFVLGPVMISKYHSMIERFQSIDMMAMMGITAGGLQKKLIYLANGANLAFTRSVFEQLGGYPSTHIASGDDVMLIHQAVIHKKKITFLKNKKSIVSTQALSTWKLLLNQRTRWASKTTSYIRARDRNVAIFLFVFFCSIIFNIILGFFTNGQSLLIAFVQLLLKAIIDFWFLKKINEFFQLKNLLGYFIPLFIIQFAIFLWSGIASIFIKKYQWKGRNIN